jgi:hypothetical protein
MTYIQQLTNFSNYQFNVDTSNFVKQARVQYSSDNGVTWNTISGTELIEGTGSSEADYDWINMSYTFILDSWVGSRKIRLAGRSYSTTNEFTIGRQYYASGSEGVSACPHVSIYSVNL